MDRNSELTTNFYNEVEGFDITASKVNLGQDLIIRELQEEDTVVVILVSNHKLHYNTEKDRMEVCSDRTD
ncbi:hypothetical protein K4L44_01875 [Halosquirtibacter laminarini]|uniref:Uncharacterized protein n=1 Tax=Halosquirtibacter laminarini TaxID=3374600 RepID=A0AC61NP79_9BACT|nr:hypothetical protein K4L44_01875 [Prolixibacteraceae bacterium]